MPDPARALLAAAVAAVLALGATGAAAAAADHRVAFSFTDPEIVESSGLVAADGLVHTVNDSGDTGRVFSVDPRTGDTVGTTSWRGDPYDVEALAPAGPRHVWVADIGDNQHARPSVAVTRVPVGPGDLTVSGETFELRYPGGTAHDAEALLAHPGTGRLYVATKGLLSGELFRAPATLRAGRVNRLRPVGRVTNLVTDGAFLPDGRHVVLRTYGRAVVYTFPGLDRVGSWGLPSQPQGEGIAVLGPRRVLLSSEGQHAEVLSVRVPAELVADMRDRPGGGDGPVAAAGDLIDGLRDPVTWPVVLGGGLLVGLLTVVWRRRRAH